MRLVRGAAADQNGEIGYDGRDQVECRVGGFREYAKTAGRDPDDNFKGCQADGGNDR
jgi:hypothetical protein